MDGGEESPTSLYLELADRFQSLEASQNNIKEQFSVLLQEKTCKDKIENFKEKEMASDSRYRKSFQVCSFAPGAYFSASPYKRVLDYMGHAVHVSRAGSGEIIYWNKAAEKLFGYKECEVIGQRVFELLFDEEYLQSAGDIIERWSSGESWSGQLILKKKSGQIFKAMVSKSPLYEDGELIGAITVSSDANIFNNTNLEYSRTLHDHANDQPKVRGINWKKIQWHPQPQIASVPQLASSVSELASKVLSCKRGDAAFSFSKTTRESEEAEVESQGMKADRPPRAPPAKPIFNLSIGNSRTKGESSEQDESTFDFAQPSKIAAKVISKLHIGGISKKFMDENMQQNGSDDASKIQEVENEPCSPRVRMVNIANIDANNCEDNAKKGACYAVERKHLNMHVNSSDTTDNSCIGAYCVNQFPRSILQLDERVCVPNVPDMKSKDVGDASPRQPDSQKFPSSDGSDGGNGCGSTSRQDDSELLMVADCEIRWEDLQLREQIGQGSFAVVYRGTWNGSDVAVKVYCGNQYSEGALLDYKKEIDIMRRLRHPNVLLFMGAVCSREKFAMVTEYLPRGSLFKTLHKNNQSLDIRRRLTMAIDVARGMNYLHRRNPPIVHRDLKSSNLLVDKSWTVKVGDFGLSRLKNATFLTAKSGRGTPQWMAPEVLRNEPSTEKSDVFSFGVILWELMTECIPWSNLNSLQVVEVVGFMDRRLEIPKSIDPGISSIISDCWQSNLENRPSFEDIIYKMTDLVHAGAGVTKTTSTP